MRCASAAASSPTTVGGATTDGDLLNVDGTQHDRAAEPTAVRSQGALDDETGVHRRDAGDPLG